MLISTLTTVRITVLFLLIIVFVFPISTAQRTSTATTESFWTAGAPMPTPRTEVTAAVLKDDIYVIGGFDESSQVTDIVEVYNITNNTWTKAAPLPEPLHHTTTASYDDKIYVIGGYTAPWSPSNKLFIYDPVQNKWQEGNPMPTARGALNVNFIDGKIFVIGGRISGSLENISVNEAYDPEQDKWITNLEAMPSKRSGIAAVAAVAAFPVNGSSSNIYVFGGEEPSKTFNNNEKYDANTNKWTSEPPMPTARHGLGAVYIEEDNKIYVIGGGPQPGLSVTDANEIFHVR